MYPLVRSCRCKSKKRISKIVHGLVKRTLAVQYCRIGCVHIWGRASVKFPAGFKLSATGGANKLLSRTIWSSPLCVLLAHQLLLSKLPASKALALTMKLSILLFIISLFGCTAQPNIGSIGDTPVERCRDINVIAALVMIERELSEYPEKDDYMTPHKVFYKVKSDPSKCVKGTLSIVEYFHFVFPGEQKSAYSTINFIWSDKFNSYVVGKFK